MYVAKTINSTKLNAVQEVSQSQKKWFTDDDMIEAWSKGRKSYEIKMQKEFEKNLSAAQKLSVDFADSLYGKEKIKCKRIYLKQSSIYDFSFIFTIPEKHYLSFDDFKKINLKLNNFIQNRKNKSISISTMFMPYSSKTNKDSIAADGYNYTFING